MLDIGWTEILIIMVVALVVIGPRDLPKVVRTIGQWMGKARGYARDFQRTIEEAADHTEMDAIRKEIDEANRELRETQRDVGEQVAGVHEDMNQATRDTAVVNVDQEMQAGEEAAEAAKANSGNGAAATPELGAAYGVPSEPSPANGDGKQGEQEIEPPKPSANA